MLLPKCVVCGSEKLGFFIDLEAKGLLGAISKIQYILVRY